MGLNLCPIEPDDWANGPNEPEPNCPDCEGLGTIEADAPGVHDLEVTCPKCGGSGYVHDDYDYDTTDVI